MPDDNAPPTGYTAAVLFGSALALAGAVWLGVLLVNHFNPATEVVQSDRGVPLLPNETAANQEDERTPEPSPTAAPITSEPTLTPLVEAGAESTATPEPSPVLTPRLLLDSDLGTGSREFSAVALNEDLARLLIADDEGRLFEFDLDEQGLPVTPLRRTLSVQIGGGDIEGLSWMFANTYAIAHENDGQITVVEFDDDATAVTSDNLVRTIDTLIREEDGNGLEGVSYVPGYGDIEFVVVDERPPTMYLIDRQSNIVARLLEDAGLVSDFSDVYVSPAGDYSLLSDEGRVVLDLTIDARREPVLVDQVDLALRAGRFEQPEGLVRSRDGTRLYVVGEAPGPDRFSFGFWSSD